MSGTTARVRPWRKINWNEKSMIVSVFCDHNSHSHIMVSDLAFLWKESYSDQDLHLVFTKLNPLIESEDESSLVKKVVILLQDHFDGKGGDTVFEADNDILKMKFKTKMGGMPLKLELELKKQPPSVFHEELLLPFLQGAMELLSRQDFLFKLLEAKDREIAEYKLVGAEISRANVKTKPFNKEEFLSKYHSNSNSQDLQSFLDTINQVSVESEVLANSSLEKQVPSNEIPFALVRNELPVTSEEVQDIPYEGVHIVKVESCRTKKRKLPRLRL